MEPSKGMHFIYNWPSITKAVIIPSKFLIFIVVPFLHCFPGLLGKNEKTFLSGKPSTLLKCVKLTSL